MRRKVKNTSKINTEKKIFWSGEDKDTNIRAIIDSLEFLRCEANKIGNEDIAGLIEATFTMCLHAHALVLKNELATRILDERINQVN